MYNEYMNYVNHQIHFISYTQPKQIDYTKNVLDKQKIVSEIESN